MKLSEVPRVRTGMLIRQPVHDVYRAFVDPAITTQFWFTRSSGMLEPGARIKWHWDMYGASADVNVLEMEENERILVEWGDDESGYTSIEWLFTAREDHTTYVTITNSGFRGNGDEIVNQAIDAMEGFTMVLCGLKALLEHGISLNLVGDKAPDDHVKQEP